MPTLGAAVLIAAKERGYFAKHGINATLTKEVGWATIREKLMHNELHAVHAPAAVAYTIHCGIGVVPRPCVTGFILSLNGSAITLSAKLWEKGVRDAVTLGSLIKKERRHTTYNFGAVFEFSAQNYNLRKWLASGGIDPDRDVRIPFVPSPILHRSLLEGHLDGYCVGEPWNSIVAQSGAGWIVAATSEIEHRQTEKVFLVLEEFAEKRGEEHLAMIAALIEASAFCEAPENRPELVRLLAGPKYLDVSPAVLASSLIGPFNTGMTTRKIPSFVTFHAAGANVPDRNKGRQVFNEVRALPAAESCRALRPDVIGRIFREDLYRQAELRLSQRESAPPAGSRRPQLPPPPSAGSESSEPLRMALAG